MTLITKPLIVVVAIKAGQATVAFLGYSEETRRMLFFTAATLPPGVTIPALNSLDIVNVTVNDATGLPTLFVKV